MAIQSFLDTAPRSKNPLHVHPEMLRVCLKNQTDTICSTFVSVQLLCTSHVFLRDMCSMCLRGLPVDRPALLHTWCTQQA